MTRASITEGGRQLMGALAPHVRSVGVQAFARLPDMQSIRSALYRDATVDYGLRVARALGIGVTLTQSRAGEIAVELDLDVDAVREMADKAVDL